jgi:integrase/recombinase XerC
VVVVSPHTVPAIMPALHSLLAFSPEISLPAIDQGGMAARHVLLQFFNAEIRNPNTRRAYQKAAADFFATCATLPGGRDLAGITSLHVSHWLETMAERGLTAPTIKQRLAGVRMLFQSLLRERIVTINPAAVVRGPRHSVKRGKTSVLAGDEARQLLEAIDITTLAGLRDRALIATMIYSFARIGAVMSLTCEDVFTEQRRLWLRLHEKGGKRHELPCHHHLETYLVAYMERGNFVTGSKAPVFQTLADDDESRRGRWQRLSGKPLSQPIAWAIMQRRAAAASLATRICNHTFRATGITTYLKNGGTIERAAAIANHASTRTTQLYDRRPDDVTLDEIERIQI